MPVGNCRLVIFVRPEAVRSIRVQDEVGITLHGGPKRSGTISSFDMRIGAKNQSCTAIAGSHRNIPQDSLCFNVLGVQTLIMQVGTERSHCIVKLRILTYHMA